MVYRKERNQIPYRDKEKQKECIERYRVEYKDEIKKQMRRYYMKNRGNVSGNEMIKIPEEKVYMLYRDGESINRIAKEIGSARSTISRFLRKRGIRIRNCSEQRKLSIKLGNIIIKRGRENHNFKGGISITERRGYIIHSILQSDGSRKEFREHRLIWEKANGKIPKNSSIHHLNGIKDDNRLENLALLPNKKHDWSTILQPYKDRIKILEKRLKEVGI